MRITVGQLRQIIREEVSVANKRRRLYEFGEPPPPVDHIDHGQTSAHHHRQGQQAEDKDNMLYGACKLALDAFEKGGTDIAKLRREALGGWGLGDNTREVLKTFKKFKNTKHVDLQTEATPFLEALVDFADGTILDSAQKKSLIDAGILDLFKGYAKEDRPYGR